MSRVKTDDDSIQSERNGGLISRDIAIGKFVDRVLNAAATQNHLLPAQFGSVEPTLGWTPVDPDTRMPRLTTETLPADVMAVPEKLNELREAVKRGEEWVVAAASVNDPQKQIDKALRVITKAREAYERVEARARASMVDKITLALTARGVESRHKINLQIGARTLFGDNRKSYPKGKGKS